MNADIHAVMKYLRCQGWSAAHIREDVVAAKGDHMLCIALQTDRRKSTDAQERWYAALKDVGAKVYSAMLPGDWPKLENTVCWMAAT